jgi:hypothetical protein
MSGKALDVSSATFPSCRIPNSGVFPSCRGVFPSCLTLCRVPSNRRSVPSSRHCPNRSGILLRNLHREEQLFFKRGRTVQGCTVLQIRAWWRLHVRMRHECARRARGRRPLRMGPKNGPPDTLPLGHRAGPMNPSGRLTRQSLVDCRFTRRWLCLPPDRAWLIAGCSLGYSLCVHSTLALFTHVTPHSKATRSASQYRPVTGSRGLHHSFSVFPRVAREDIQLTRMCHD